MMAFYICRCSDDQHTWLLIENLSLFCLIFFIATFVSKFAIVYLTVFSDSVSTGMGFGVCTRPPIFLTKLAKTPKKAWAGFDKTVLIYSFRYQTFYFYFFSVNKLGEDDLTNIS